ncbi:MAG: FtsQ-type POTRA domain-containing protein [Candidatus Eisenbacteria bacterium]
MRDDFHSILPPRKRRRSWAPLFAVLILLVTLAGGVLLLPQLGLPRFWTVRSIELEGNRALDREDLLSRLGLADGMPWWRVSPGALRAAAAREPRLLTAEFDVHFPRSIRVRVSERAGMLRVIDAQGSASLELAADGTLLDVVPGLTQTDLPWLTGTLPGPLVAGRTIELPRAQGWTEQLAKLRSDWPAFWSDLSELRYAGDAGFELYLRAGRKVVLWDPARNGDLWAEVPRVLSDLEQWHVDDAVLNLRFRDQVVVKPASDEMPDFERPDPDAIEGESKPESRPSVPAAPKAKKTTKQRSRPGERVELNGRRPA